MEPFFIIGPPKTGTTILTRLIVQHPEVTSISESYVLEPDRPGSIANPSGTNWKQHGFEPEQAEHWRSELRTKDPSEALQSILNDAWQRMKGKTTAQVFGDSWPFYFNYLDSLEKAFPNAKFIYTTRDPRAVYWSGETFRNRRQGPWNSQLLLSGDRQTRPFIEKFQRQTLIVHYEDLIQHAGNEMERIWSHIGVDASRGYIEYDPDQDPWPERWSFIPNATKPIDPTRPARWKNEMPEEISKVMSIAAADYMKQWEYPLDLPQGKINAEMVSSAFLCGAPLNMFGGKGEGIVRNALYQERQQRMIQGDIENILLGIRNNSA